MRGFQVEIFAQNAASIQLSFRDAEVTKVIISDSEPAELGSAPVSFGHRHQC
jgi:hypothetical protein